LFRKYSLVFIFLLSQNLQAERSMFGAGDLESSSPYGLTNAEKVIVKNKKILKDNEKRIKKVDALLGDLAQRLDGVESILDSEGAKTQKHTITLKKHQEAFLILEQKQQDQKDELLKLIKAQSEQIKVNNQNIILLQKSLDKIVSVVNKINANYITKKQFNNLISLLDKKQSTSKPKKKSEKKLKSKKSNNELIQEVRVLFKKDYFTKAIPILEYLLEKNYRPAECNYYLGDISYYRKKYKNALYYFKKSMTLYDKAKYIPKLLLHSAISFEKLGDEQNAQNFYNTLVDIYPDSKEAKQASKKIK
jgi:TolA-binding protein